MKSTEIYLVDFVENIFDCFTHMDSVRHYCLVLSHEDQVRISQAQDKLQVSSRSGQSWELSYTEYRLQLQQFTRLSHKSKYVRLRLSLRLGVAKYRRVSVGSQVQNSQMESQSREHEFIVHEIEGLSLPTAL